ncbi:MAG: hypothetical protein Q4F18_14210 [Clostridia bacterium]|nr:hypothetical protein [Clostridia bacterium]
MNEGKAAPMLPAMGEGAQDVGPAALHLCLGGHRRLQNLEDLVNQLTVDFGVWFGEFGIQQIF